MAKGHDASDWTVEHTGDEGTVECDEYRGRFRVRPGGVVRIIWTQGKGPPPKEDHPVSMAAQEAIDAAIRRRA